MAGSLAGWITLVAFYSLNDSCLKKELTIANLSSPNFIHLSFTRTKKGQICYNDKNGSDAMVELIDLPQVYGSSEP